MRGNPPEFKMKRLTESGGIAWSPFAPQLPRDPEMLTPIFCRRFNIFWLPIATLVCLLTTSATTVGETTVKRPNIIFFLVDDLGQRDVGCYGSKFYETPAIDQLAQEGVLFENAYSTCHVCSPSRASILTGKYPARLNLTDWLPGRPERDYEVLHSANRVRSLPDQEVTLAATLKRHGYATANYGKAHLNRNPKSYGFDEAITGWVRSYYPPYSPQYQKSLPAENGEYFTDRLTTAAIDFIERNQDRPFFVHMEHFAVHDPIQGRNDLVKKYEAKLGTLQKAENPEYLLESNPDGPIHDAGSLQTLRKQDTEEAHQRHRIWWVKQRQNNPQFAAMVEAVDQSLGRIRAKVQQLGLEDNTIIVFTSDNGGMAASNQYRGISHSTEVLNSRFSTSNHPLRGAKGWNYEGGIRVPLVVHWPGQVKKGSRSTAIVTGTDYYPTLLDMLGLPSMPDQHLDGVSFTPALKHQAYERGAIFWHFQHYSNHGYQSPNGAIRKGRYKLIEYFENGTVQLFDLVKDQGEKIDLSKALPETCANLLKELRAWRRSVDAQMPALKADTPLENSSPTSLSMQQQVEAFSKPWKIKNWGGPAMNPGLREQWQGKSKVLVTHPKSEEIPCVLSAEIRVPATQSPKLVLAVSNHPKGDWVLAVKIDGKSSLVQKVDQSKWQQIELDLSDYSGRKINIELENRANNWSFEAGYWGEISIRRD